MSEHTIGAFKVIRPLARGGMGETFIARSPEGELVVLKRLLGHLCGDAEAERCFQEEIRIAGRLEHPNIVRFIEQIEHEDQPVLVLEYVDGCSARDLILDARKRGDPFRVAEACAIAEATGRGLHYAHSLADDAGNPMGMVHRDVSPANILVSRTGEVRVIDFGVAKAWDAEGQTATGVVKGKVGYMSPEHTQGEAVDARSDVFALGIVLWELLVCDRLFAGDGPVATAYKVLEAPIPKPSSRRDSIPAQVDAICMNALERDRDRRTESAEAMRRSLQRWLERERGDVDLGALVRDRFPIGLPESSDSAPTQIARGRGASGTATATLGQQAMSLPPPPAPPGIHLQDAAQLDNADLSRTYYDQGMESRMHTVVRLKRMLRLVAVAVAVLVAAAVLSTLWLDHQNSTRPLPEQKIVNPTFFAFTDSHGVQVIVGSLLQVPPERRPSARRLDLARSALTIQDDNTHRQRVQRDLAELRNKLGSDESGVSLIVALKRLAPLVGLGLVGLVFFFFLVGRVRDGFVRWTLRLLLVFLASVGMFRAVTSSGLSLARLRDVAQPGHAIPVDKLAPSLKKAIEGLGQTAPGALGKLPKGIDLD